jgi:hypothetical protein
MGWLNDFDLASFVAASCERHGVPLKVNDESVRDRVAVLLTGGAGRGTAQRCPTGPPGSDSPDQIDPTRIEG